ncbi:MAG: hypothetical protein AM324_014365, partial [Candidatus Thorarchaeota archaeon SMTZ1-83]
LLWASASEGQQWADGITEMTNTIKKLGPSPLAQISKTKKEPLPKTQEKEKATKKATPKKTPKKAAPKKTPKKTAPKRASKKGGAKK